MNLTGISWFQFLFLFWNYYVSRSNIKHWWLDLYWTNASSIKNDHVCIKHESKISQKFVYSIYDLLWWVHFILYNNLARAHKRWCHLAWGILLFNSWASLWCLANFLWVGLYFFTQLKQNPFGILKNLCSGYRWLIQSMHAYIK